MIHRMDPPADPDREPMPERLVPMLARAGDAAARRRRAGRFEIKWDGVRAIAYSEPGRLRLESRNLNDITAALSGAARAQPARSARTRAILDGEIVAFDERRPAELRRACSSACTSPRGRRRGGWRRTRRSTYVVFDLLWLDGHSLMELPYERAPRAAGGARARRRPHWQTPDHVVGDGAALLAASARAGPRGRRRQAARLARTSPAGARPAG